MQDAYRFVMADEFQDTSRHNSSCSVRSSNATATWPSLAIQNKQFLEWRGADPSILLDFPQQYPEARVFRWTRTTGQRVLLLRSATFWRRRSQVAASRGQPMLRARALVSTPPVDETRRGGFVAARSGIFFSPARSTIRRGRGPVSNQRASQRPGVETAGAGPPFRVRSDSDLFAQPEIRDIVAYLRLAHSPTDGPALARVVNVPPRRLRAIEQALRKRPVPVAELPLWAQKRGGPSARRAVEDLLAMLGELQHATRECRPAEALEIVLERTAFRGWLESQKDGPSKLHRVEELQSVLESSPAPDLATWLIDMHLGDVDGPAYRWDTSHTPQHHPWCQGRRVAGRLRGWV